MKAVILCNGEQPHKVILEEHITQAEIFIACDGAAEHALRANYVPDRV